MLIQEFDDVLANLAFPLLRFGVERVRLALPFDYSQQVELMVTTTKDGNALRSETRARFDRMIERLQRVR